MSTIAIGKLLCYGTTFECYAVEGTWFALYVTKSSITETKTSNSLKPVSQSPTSNLSVLSLACTTFPLTVPCNHQLPRSVPIVTISVIIARVIAVAKFVGFVIVRSVRMMLDLLVVDVLQNIGELLTGRFFQWGRR